jgi:hypothetical protein
MAMKIHPTIEKLLDVVSEVEVNLQLTGAHLEPVTNFSFSLKFP